MLPWPKTSGGALVFRYTAAAAGVALGVLSTGLELSDVWVLYMHNIVSPADQMGLYCHHVILAGLQQCMRKLHGLQVACYGWCSHTA